MPQVPDGRPLPAPSAEQEETLSQKDCKKTVDGTDASLRQARWDIFAPERHERVCEPDVHIVSALA